MSFMRIEKAMDPIQYGPLPTVPYTTLVKVALTRILSVKALSHVAWSYGTPSCRNSRSSFAHTLKKAGFVRYACSPGGE